MTGVPDSGTPSPAPSPDPGAPPTTRPGGVTYAGVLGVVYGTFWLIGGLLLLVGGAAFASVFRSFVEESDALAASIIGGVFAFLGVFGVIIGVVGLIVALNVLKGRAWARWTAVALFGVDAFFGFFAGFGLILPWAFTALDVVAIVMLTREESEAYFRAMDGRATTSAAA